MKPSARSKLLQFLLLATLLIIAAILLKNRIFKSYGPRGIAESVSNGRQIKLAMDTFAMDNDGLYPNAATAEFYELPPPTTANDYFKQLFASGNTNNEKLFWIRNHRLSNERKPDDITTTSKIFDPSKILLPGDNAWAYTLSQTNVDNPERPLLFESPPTASGLTFDTKLWDSQTIVINIDGSANIERLTKHGKLIDSDKNELLIPANKVWQGHTPTFAYPATQPEER